MKTAIDTRNQSYRALDRSTNRARVYDIIAQRGPITDREIANCLDWPINCVTGRRHELVELGFVASAGKIKDKLTGMTVHAWTVSTGQFELFRKE